MNTAPSFLHEMENDADLRTIQELLSHARLDTTQIYTAVCIMQLRETHIRCYPRGSAKAKADLPP